MFEFNWLSQSLAALAALLIGYLWYGVLFSKQWMKATGLNEEKIRKGLHPGVLYGITLLMAFIISIGLRSIIVGLHNAFHSTTEYPFFHGMYHGAIISIIFGAIPALVTNSLFDQRNLNYILINAGYWLLTFSIMGGIIGQMG